MTILTDPTKIKESERLKREKEEKLIKEAEVEEAVRQEQEDREIDAQTESLPVEVHLIA